MCVSIFVMTPCSLGKKPALRQLKDLVCMLVCACAHMYMLMGEFLKEK